MSEAKAPSADELAAAAGGLKKAETKAEGATFDEAPYKAAWDSAGGDAAAVTEKLGLKKVPADYTEYINMCKLGKFKDAGVKETWSRPRYLRVNTLRVSYEDAITHLVTLGWVPKGVPGRWSYTEDPALENVLGFPPRTSFHGDALVEAGSLIIQDRSSCIPAVALAPPKGSHVIDCCAAPGNKTSHAAALLEGTGKLFAFERNPKRCETLRRQMDKFGVNGIEVFCMDFMHVDPNDERFSKVTHFLCDPTCSGSGQLANQYAEAEESRAAGQLSTEDLEALADAQVAIVLHCMSFPAAVAVTYSTCSVHEAENESVVAKILQKTSKFQAVQCLPKWESRGRLSHGPAGPLCCRASHDEDLTNGFFCARFERIRKRKTRG